MSTTIDLSGKVALVTGGSRGLGREMVLGFARAGADVVIASRKLDACQELADVVTEETGRRALPVAAHIGRWDDVDRLVDTVYSELGRLDVLVNNAGMAPLYPRLSAVSEELFDKVIGVNLKGPFRLGSLVGERMQAGDGGSIINISSIGAVHPTMTDLPYAAAKAGLNTLTIGFALSFGPSVRSNGIMVGPFLTDISKAWDVPAYQAHAKRRYPLQRLGEPSEIVGTALYLASDASSFTTGTTLTVDGGILASSPFMGKREPSESSSERTIEQREPSERTIEQREPSESASERTIEQREPSESASERTIEQDSVDVGLSVYDITGRELVELGRAAEAAGFSSLWLGEHVVLPVDYAAEHPTTGSSTNTSHLARIVDPATRLLDPLVALSAVAAVTERITLATGIYLVALRHPLAVARMTLTLQDVAGGRFMLGVGSGWLEEEFAALGVPFAERRARFDEALAVLRAAWAGGEVSFGGEHVAFEHVMVTPQPVTVPLILGGNTEPALRRAARVADGWFSSGNPSFEEAVRLRDRLGVLAAEAGRTLPVHVRMAGRDAAQLARYAEHGFEHVIVWADQLWPEEGGLASKQGRFAEAAAGMLSAVGAA